MSLKSDTIKVLPTAIVCESEEGEIRGDITIASGCVIHPSVTIIAKCGPIVIGENCLMEEYATILNSNANGEPLVIGPNNVFEIGCTVEARKIGDKNVFECKSYVSNKVTVTNNCIIGAGCRLVPERILAEKSVIYGNLSEDREAIEIHSSQTLQLEHLRRVLPNYHHFRKANVDTKKNRGQVV